MHATTSGGCASSTRPGVIISFLGVIGQATEIHWTVVELHGHFRDQRQSRRSGARAQGFLRRGARKAVVMQAAAFI